MIDINKELSQNFIDFSHEANNQRAFADARDGLKPGQRACLWEMFVKGYSSNKPHVKSAKISGGTAAVWWPHGTTAIYETFARMSQPWINNIPEVDWHGANGSIQISGEPAADRYTEARLSKTSEDGLLQNIKKQNVEMKLNFSEDEEWPVVFPALFPRLLVNGCQGIGSTIANHWMCHSLDEIADSIITYATTGTIDYSKLAPSFPTGGIIINKNELETIYRTGRGRVILRAKTKIIGNKIIITEIPYQTYVEPLIEDIKNLVIKEEISGISNIFNKSNKSELLIEIECDKDAEQVLSLLFAKTDLQKTFNANQYALVGKTPRLLNYQKYLDIFLSHNYECIKNEHIFDLEKSKARLEIVEGLIKALEDIDNIILIIKKSNSSSDAQKNLIKKYSFTENQARAIVDMKLGRLAHLEKIELNEERTELTSTVKKCEDVIASLSLQKEIYLERFREFVKKHPNPRKTELAQIDEPLVKGTKVQKIVEPEKCVVVMTAGGLVKKIPTASFKTQNRNTKGIKSQDDITSAIIRTNSVDSLLVFTNRGNMYKLAVDDIPTGTNVSRGISVSNLAPLAAGETPAAIYSLYKDNSAEYIVFVTKRGSIKKTSLSEFSNTRKKSGIQAITLADGDSLASVFIAQNENVFLVTEKGMGIKFSLADVTPTGKKSAGVRAINLNDGDYVAACIPEHDSGDDIAIFTKSGLGKRVKQNEITAQKRGGKGLIFSKNEIVIGAAFVNDEDNILINGIKSSVCISAKDIPLRGRTASGVSIIKDNIIQSISKI